MLWPISSTVTYFSGLTLGMPSSSRLGAAPRGCRRVDAAAVLGQHHAIGSLGRSSGDVAVDDILENEIHRPLQRRAVAAGARGLDGHEIAGGKHRLLALGGQDL